MAKLAINGGQPVRTQAFPAWPMWDQREIDAVTGVIKSGCWGLGSGHMVKDFQREFAEFIGVRRAVAITNGSNAIEVALTALDIGPGDEVIVPDYTFMSTGTEVLRVGAVPIFVDVDERTFCIDPTKIEAVIGSRTRAIIPVHFAGHPADMDALKKIADKYHLKWVEDCSHAHGALWQNRKVGSFADIATFSMQASKTMTGGEGGIVVTDDETLADECMSVVNCGRRKGRGNYEHFRLASNFRMSELIAAVLRVQLTRLPELLKIRNRNARLLDAKLNSIPGITTGKPDPRMQAQGLYVYPFLYDSAKFAGVSRELFMNALRAEGIPVEVSYPAMHELEVFRKYQFIPKGRREAEACYADHPQKNPDNFPVASRLARQMIWIPNGSLIADADAMADIAAAIEKIHANCAELAGR
ncbi:MAG: DegT/DnrJ/EryC1/StrS family aminotransferase [Victivallales bacterium]